MSDFVIKTGSLLEPLFLTLRASDGTAIDLTSATSVLLSVRDPAGSLPVVTGGTMSVVSPPTAGRVRYDWQAADVDTPGLYLGEVRVAWGSGSPQRIPADGYLVFDMQPALEAA